MALIVALLASLVLSALGLMLLMVTSTETLIAGNYRDGVEALHAADAALERVIADVAPLTDWSTALASPDGVVSAIRSTFGDAALSAEMLDGRTLDLAEDDEPAELSAGVSAVLHAVQRRSDGPAYPAIVRGEATTRGGGCTPRGRLTALAPGPARRSISRLGADDPAETDGDPARDGIAGGNPGAGVLQLRAEAFGPGGAHRAVEATIGRAAVGVRVISWRLVR